MCGIFGYVGSDDLDASSAKTLVTHAQQRGRDSSGMVIRDILAPEHDPVRTDGAGELDTLAGPLAAGSVHSR